MLLSNSFIYAKTPTLIHLTVNLPPQYSINSPAEIPAFSKSSRSNKILLFRSRNWTTTADLLLPISEIDRKFYIRNTTMHKTAQSWFTGGPSLKNSDLNKQPPSLLADWNAYAASSQSNQDLDSSGLGFDLEAAVRSANDKVSGTFNVVSKGVRDMPGNLQSATSNVPTGKSLMTFGMLLAVGVFLVFIAVTVFLPVMVLVPQKFAICFTIGCALIIASFFALKGYRTQFAHMTSKERLPITLGFIGSMVGTIYVSMVLHSYVLSVFFSLLQVISLSYYAISYFPGGSAGVKFFTSALASSILRCFGR